MKLRNEAELISLMNKKMEEYKNRKVTIDDVWEMETIIVKIEESIESYDGGNKEIGILIDKFHTEFQRIVSELGVGCGCKDQRDF